MTFGFFLSVWPAAKNLYRWQISIAPFSAYRWSKDRGPAAPHRRWLHSQSWFATPQPAAREDIATSSRFHGRLLSHDQRQRLQSAFVGRKFHRAAGKSGSLPRRPAAQTIFPQFTTNPSTHRPLTKPRNSTDTNHSMAWKSKPPCSNLPATMANRNFPLIALIHGGPTGAWESSIEGLGPASRRTGGYAVFSSQHSRLDWGTAKKFVESKPCRLGEAETSKTS